MSYEFPKKLITEINNAENVTVLTGAGISAESGVPTFREAQTGLWAKYRPEDLATPQAFMRNPPLVWKWYTWRRELVAKAKPNPGHQALVDMEKHIKHFNLLTQNVDGLHQRAGSGIHSPIVELHGNIARVKCFNENIPFQNWAKNGEIPPRCPHCGGLLRPDVVWFGESLAAETLQAAWEAAASCQVFLSVGTSTIVEPAASLPFIAIDSGATVIEINPGDTPLTNSAQYRFKGPSGKILPALAAAVWGRYQDPFEELTI